ncbi:MAG: outer membrane beta-barrel family protein, partial [Muribaculaceae bacterium]|nr:outer membrane beta-barrel family protein [Muribaculaceae bacterium]
SRNPKDVFKSIPASMIQRIEVITEPGAKYDAEGVNGILNIVMMDNTTVRGAAGSVSASMNTNGTPGAYAYVTAQLGKFTTTVNYGLNGMTRKENSSWSTTLTDYNETGAHTEATSVGDHSGLMQYGNMEASLEIDSLNLLTMSIGGFWYGIDPVWTGHEAMYDAQGNMMYGYDTNTGYRKYGYFDFNGKLDYQHLTHRKDESIVLSYLLSTTDQTNDSWVTYFNAVNLPVDYTHRDGNNKLKFYEHTFQFDYTRPFGKGHKLETGSKYILRINDSKTDYVYSNPALNKFTDFRHITQVGALYAEYAYNAAKWGARAGVRYEFAHLSAKYPNGSGEPFKSNIGDVVPTLSLNYKINDRNSLKLNFATRINRPGISYLNPAVNMSPTTVSYGNPDLESSRRHSLKLSYSLMTEKFTTVLSFNGAMSNNQVTSYITVVPDENGNDVVYSTYGNIGRNQSAGMSVYLQWRCTSKTTFMLNGDMNYDNTKNRSLAISNG